MNSSTFIADGEKLSRTTDGETTYYVYDGNTVILELDDEKSEAARNVYGRNIVSRDAADSTLYFNFNGHGNVIRVATTYKMERRL